VAYSQSVTSLSARPVRVLAFFAKKLKCVPLGIVEFLVCRLTGVSLLRFPDGLGLQRVIWFASQPPFRFIRGVSVTGLLSRLQIRQTGSANARWLFFPWPMFYL